MKITNVVTEYTNTNNNKERLTIGFDGTKYFLFTCALPSEFINNRWTHYKGVNANGFVNWETNLVEGINPDHTAASVYINPTTLKDYNNN